MSLTQISAPVGSDAGGQAFASKQQPPRGSVPPVTHVVPATHCQVISINTVILIWRFLTHIPAAAQNGAVAGQVVQMPATHAPPPAPKIHYKIE